MTQSALDALGALDIRVGTVLSVAAAKGARKPAWRLTIDFGPEIGVKASSAQLTKHYDSQDLAGRQVAAVVNLPPRRIAGFVSEVLVVAMPDEAGEPVLIVPERRVPNGGRLY